VVREFILSHWHKLSVFLDSVVMLITPNGGNQLTNFSQYFCDSSSLKDLEAGKDGYIDGLNDRWREKFERTDSIKPFLFSAGYELVPFFRIGLIVEKVSATIFSQQISAFKKDHSTIAKPFSISDSIYIWVKQRLLKKPPDPEDKALSDKEEKQYTETIAKLQQELQENDLEKALQLIEENQLDKALALLSEREMKEDEKIEKITGTRYAKEQVYELKLDYNNALKYYEKAV
jgi:hypothetical protein